MAAGRTYTPIATTTLSSDLVTVTFSSIPATYTDLVAIINTKLISGTTNINYRFNSDSGSNYSYTQLGGNGASALSARATSQTSGRFTYNGFPTTDMSVYIANIFNYSNTTTYKTAISRSSNAANGADAVVSLWRSTDAVNAIDFIGNATNKFATGSTFTLYGIAAA